MTRAAGKPLALRGHAWAGDRAVRRLYTSIDFGANLWELDRATEDAILDYLAASYPPRPERRRAPIPPSLMPPAAQ